MNRDSVILKSLLENISGCELLSEEDKSYWRSRAGHLPPEIMIFLARLFAESPDDIARINENVKIKTALATSLDRARWEELLAKEKTDLESLSKKETL